MARILRKLDQATWWDTKEGQSPEDLGSDSLKNAKSTRHEISVYRFEDDNQLQLIIAALAAKRDTLSHIDFCTFPEDVLDTAGVRMEKRPGATGCAPVDECHHDVVSLTAPSLAKFVCWAAARGEVDSIDKSEVDALIRRYLREGVIVSDMIHPKIRDKFLD